jgi:adsorption protein B
VETAVRQKARWMTGIALSGWDRLGWSGGLVERWMRLRDRQSLIAALCLLAGYIALLGAAILEVGRLASGFEAEPFGPALELMLLANAAMLVWRLAMRFGFTTHAYGWREGLRSVPRVVVSNAIAIMAARRAVIRYLAIRRSGRTSWDKTAHFFPNQLPAE